MKMEKIFNKDVMAIDTYIMVKLKEKTANLKDGLTKKKQGANSTFNGCSNFQPSSGTY